VRAPGTRHGTRIAGTNAIPVSDIVDRIDEMDRSHPTIFLCNGPQCPQSQKSIHMLLDAGYPVEKMWFYRGGMHDWITLRLPVAKDSKNNN
jgi:rhodanese-related sulfurtransferase